MPLKLFLWFLIGRNLNSYAEGLYPMLSKKNNKKGFTVIELVMVIVIVGIVSALVFTSFGPVESIKASAAAYEVGAALRYAQQLAMSSHQNCGVVFDPTGNSYYIYKGSTATKATDPYNKEIFEIDFDTNSSFSGVDLVSTNFTSNTIQFDSFGTPNISVQGVVVVNGASGSPTYQVTVELVTGNTNVA